MVYSMNNNISDNTMIAK